MVLLLGVTGYLNIALNNRVIDASAGTTRMSNYFDGYRTDRQSTRDQELAYYDAIIKSESSSADAIKAAEDKKLEIVSQMESELVMEGLIKASSFNFGRMLYGDGSGLLATVSSVSGTTVTCDSVKNMIEGMIVDFYNGNTKVADASGYRITYVDRVNKKITLDFSSTQAAKVAQGHKIYVQNSKGFEITGLGAIFDDSAATLYGLTKANYPWLKPYTSTTETEISDSLIQGAVDYLEEASGSNINFISCASDVRRAYQEYLGAYRRNIDVMELAGGYKAITYNGIPVVADRFVADGTMYLLNTNDFVLHQLCDWKWLEGEDGRVLKQNAGFPTYSATLVKYADLICDRPCGQAMIKNIKSTVTNPFIPTVNVTNNVPTNESTGG